MASLRDQLIHLLDVDPPRGLMVWVRESPLGHAQAAVRGREAEAVPVVDALLADPGSSARLRRNAVPLLAHLHVVAAPSPTAEEIYSASRRGQVFDPHRGRKQAMVALLADADVEVAIAAAVELLQGANPDELPGLRVQLAPLLPELRQRRFESPQVQQALVSLGGLPDALAWLEELASQTGPLPPDLDILLAGLEREAHASAAPRLRQLFTRLHPIAEGRDPVSSPIAGIIQAWDADTIQALRVLGLHLRLAPADEVPAATALLARATPAMAAVLVAEVEAPGETVVALAGAAAADAGLDPTVREAAVGRLATLARTPAEPARMAAVAALQRVRADELIGAAAARALAGVTVARS